MHKSIVKFLSFFIFSSKKRKEFRRRYSEGFRKYCLFKKEFNDWHIVYKILGVSIKIRDKEYMKNIKQQLMIIKEY